MSSTSMIPLLALLLLSRTSAVPTELAGSSANEGTCANGANGDGTCAAVPKDDVHLLQTKITLNADHAKGARAEEEEDDDARAQEGEEDAAGAQEDDEEDDEDQEDEEDMPLVEGAEKGSGVFVDWAKQLMEDSDTDASGDLSAEEIHAALQNLTADGLPLPNSTEPGADSTQVEEMFGMFDTDGDGKISLFELAQSRSTVQAEMASEIMQTATERLAEEKRSENLAHDQFAKFDTNGDGLLSGKEINGLSMKHPMLADSNQDGKLSRAELELSKDVSDDARVEQVKALMKRFSRSSLATLAREASGNSTQPKSLTQTQMSKHTDSADSAQDSGWYTELAHLASAIYGKDYGMSALSDKWKLHFGHTVKSTMVGAYEYTDNMGIYHKGASQCVMTFAGSDGTDDWVHNANVAVTNFCGFSNIHAGFARETMGFLNATADKIKETMDKCSSVTVVGHSSGGAIASLLAACANKKGRRGRRAGRLVKGIKVNKLVTFGAPAISMQQLDCGGEVCEGRRYYNDDYNSQDPIPAVAQALGFVHPKVDAVRVYHNSQVACLEWSWWSCAKWSQEVSSTVYPGRSADTKTKPSYKLPYSSSHFISQYTWRLGELQKNLKEKSEQ